MRIPCPFCGVRDASEFTYLGDASLKRPDPSAPNAERAFHDYVYLRDNPAGPHREFWHHVSGCRSWLIVTRDTRNHEVLAAEFAEPAR
jgi:heterotetrameric sarcosine oxidase delta subunit